MGTTTVTLNGRIYRLGCGDGEEARLKELSDYVSAKVDGLGAAMGQVGHDRLLVMAAILLADELFEMRDKQAEGSEGAGRRAARRPRAPAARPPSQPDGAASEAVEPLQGDGPQSVAGG